MIDVQENKDTCLIKINEDWNWVVSKKLEQMGIQSGLIRIDLSQCRWMDSEAIILIFHWMNAGHQLELVNVPDIYFEIIQILKLEKALQPINILQE